LQNEGTAVFLDILVTKFDLVMPAREALLRDIDTVKQSLINTHYQVELGNELNSENSDSDNILF
jgi:hypothetical protein